MIAPASIHRRMESEDPAACRRCGEPREQRVAGRPADAFASAIERADQQDLRPVVVSAMNGRAIDESAYPAITIGRRCARRSDQYPEITFSRLLSPSATPSMMPSDTALAPSTRERYTGNRDKSALWRRR